MFAVLIDKFHSKKFQLSRSLLYTISPGILEALGILPLLAAASTATVSQCLRNVGNDKYSKYGQHPAHRAVAAAESAVLRGFIIMLSTYLSHIVLCYNNK